MWAECDAQDSYPAGSESVVDSVVLLLVCSAPEVALGLGSEGAARPRASWPGEGLLLLLLAAGDRPDGEDGGGGWRATPQRLFSKPLDVSSTLSAGQKGISQFLIVIHNHLTSLLYSGKFLDIFIFDELLIKKKKKEISVSNWSVLAKIFWETDLYITHLLSPRKSQLNHFIIMFDKLRSQTFTISNGQMNILQFALTQSKANNWLLKAKGVSSLHEIIHYTDCWRLMNLYQWVGEGEMLDVTFTASIKIYAKSCFRWTVINILQSQIKWSKKTSKLYINLC